MRLELDEVTLLNDFEGKPNELRFHFTDRESCGKHILDVHKFRLLELKKLIEALEVNDEEI